MSAFALILAAHGVHSLVWVLGIIIVVGCLIAAGVAAFRSLWIAALVLLAVAVVAAFLLL
jgi:uncharacterized membrane protein